MRQSVSPKVAVTLIVLVIAIVAAFAVKTWMGPSVAPAPSDGKFHPHPPAGPPAPDQDQMKQIQEWKKQHPGSYTRF